MNRIILLVISTTIPTICGAQWDSIDYAPIIRDTSLVVYDSGFPFREGVYFGFEDFRDNRPGVALKDLLDEEKRPVDDLRQSDGKLYRTDSSGTARPIDMDRIWGFCERNTVYVHIGNGFNRIGLMGSIAHIVYDQTYSSWGGYYGMYGMGPTTTTVQEQRLLDMASGDFLPVNATSIAQAISTDPELLAKYESLPRKERNATETVYRFMRLFNERHPLRFPR